MVYGEKQEAIAGMPFHTAEVYIKQGTHDKASKGGKCDPAVFQETLSLPTGPQYYVTATASSFAKTSFHIKYNDAGGVAEVGLDSEPAAADTIKATTDLIKTIAPIAGFGVAASAFKTSALEPANACDAGEVDVTYQTLGEYLKGHPSR